MADVFGQSNPAVARLLDYQTITLTANAIHTYNGNFSTASILSVSQAGIEQVAGTVVCALQDQSEAAIFGGMYFETPSHLDYVERATFRNTTATTTVVVVIFGAGKTEDRRLQLATTITLASNTTVLTSSGATLDQNQVTVGTSAVQIVAASSTRRRVTIKAKQGNSNLCYIGKDNAVTTANGHEMTQGDAITLDTTGAVWAISGTAGMSMTYITESV